MPVHRLRQDPGCAGGVCAGGEAWLDQVVTYIDGNHDFVDSFVRANIPLIKCVKPQGTYLSWLDVTAVADKIGAKDLAAFIPKEIKKWEELARLAKIEPQ